jgi:hypothetical protein
MGQTQSLYKAFFYSFGGNPPPNSNSLITTTGYTSLWVGALEKGARCTRALDRGRCLGGRRATLPPRSPHPRVFFHPLLPTQASPFSAWRRASSASCRTCATSSPRRA